MDNNIKEIPKTRFAYLDNVRSLVIVLVIAMHSAVTYSGIGDWYYKEGSLEELSIFEMVFFALGQSFLQAWFMGILFFISAFLAAKALARRGSLVFIKERLFRFGLPLLIYVFIVSPIISIILRYYDPEISIFQNYIKYIANFYWISSTGPLWFVEVLLIFCLIYAILKKCFSSSIKIQSISSKNIVSIIIITGIFAFLARLIFPIDTSYFNLQFCYFVSYIVMFIAGILIGENDLLDKIANEKNIKWITLSLAIGIPFWVVIVFFGGVYEGDYCFKGGFYWQSFAYALWESLIAIGFSMGLIAYFKKNANIDNKFTCLMRDNAFGVYFFHAPILIIVSLVLRHWVFNSILKFAAVTIITSILCLVFTFLVRKIKLIRIIFK